MSIQPLFLGPTLGFASKEDCLPESRRYYQNIQKGDVSYAYTSFRLLVKLYVALILADKCSAKELHNQFFNLDINHKNVKKKGRVQHLPDSCL